MSVEPTLPDFDQLADLYWQLGVMQSPSQLHGYLTGCLSAGDELQAEQWVMQATAFIDAVEQPGETGAALLTGLLAATTTALSGGDMSLQLLLPDDAVDISQRVDALGQWCQGFMAGFVQGGKRVKQAHGQQHYSQDVSEALSDLAAISQISLTEDDADTEQREQHFFELSEYLRLASMTVYLDCRQPVAASTAPVKPPAEADAGQSAGATTSPTSLFTANKKKLH